jgi:16S rRNA (cytosine967-C5)-methyltransferase
VAISPARTAAFDILLRVEKEDAYASELLHSSRYAELSGRDHALATELVMGVLRWRSALDREIARVSSQKLDRLDLEVLTSLRTAAYQLLLLTRVPARAAVHESTELVKRAHKRSAAGFVNAVLRKLAGSPVQLYAAVDAAQTPVELAESSAHPLWLVERWIKQFGLDSARKICAYGQRVPPTAIHLAGSAHEGEIDRDRIALAAGHLLRSARTIISGDVKETKAFRNGHVAIQDEASQLVALLAGRGLSILDCCAAPGGKTRLLAALNPNSNIFALELHPHRAQLLRRLVPAGNVHVVCADVRQLPFSCGFDLVLADVPCSGTGTLARNPEIKWRLKPQDLADFQAGQLAILRMVLQHVLPGGRLVYSTCSLESEENEEVIEKALAGNAAFQLCHCRQDLDRLCGAGELIWKDLDSLVAGPYLRTIPGVHPCDGFFAAVLRRN